MKTVKTLLLGTAAGFMAIAGAQAADLPGKAAPAEYVRICDTYGAGFFFIPGTDTCLRIGGNVAATYQLNSTPGTSAAGVLSTSYFDQTSSTSIRATLTFDARSNTEYGLLRSFAQVGFQRGGFTGGLSSQGLVNSGIGQSPNASGLFLDRAFIQFAGFTFGHAASFFNFYQGDVQLSGNLAASARALPVFAYTASFGSGFSATISLENGYLRRYGNQDVYVNTAAPALGSAVANLARPYSSVSGLTYAGQQIPDIVANLRVDQGWGSVQIMGALHQIRDFGSGPNPIVAGLNFNQPSNRAGDKWGFAVGAGLRLNLDMIARGNVLWLQGVYSDGALDYAFGTAAQGGDRQTISGAGNLAGANANNTQLRDAVVVGAGAAGSVIRTTQAWSLAAGFRHFWTPALRSSIFGSYSLINQPLLSGLTDVRYWTLGVNTIWSPVRNLDLGVEVVYHNINNRCSNAAFGTALNGCPAAGGPFVVNGTNRNTEGAWVGTFRAQRNF